MVRCLQHRSLWLTAFAPLLALVLLLGHDARALAAESFKAKVGNVDIGTVDSSKPLQVPYILWGGDVATFQANGGLKTQSKSVYGEMGLDLRLVPGDDFVEQVRRYMRGESPFLRGTLRMIGLASEVIGSDPRTEGVVFLQMTWSAGDHLVGREGLKYLRSLVPCAMNVLGHLEY